MSEIENPENQGEAAMEQSTAVSGMYETWFLDYASYVILDRAVPYIEDGLKPVQRRILHAMKELDDGRFNKVANIIGFTMQYHPHGDAAIGGAIVNMGQKDLLIETQGNWGNILTGDGAAAPRYIEARLSKFALEVAFNARTTNWQMSYDGRKPEPVTLPMKFPMVLAQGVEGIAVGLSTKIMAHNFRELCEASIAHLKGRSFKLYPDFPTGGMIDIENYNWGKRGGKIRCRARIEETDKKTLTIREIPYGQTTQTIIDSILKANDKGKLKIKKVEDNTARNVEIIIHLPSGIAPAVMIDALYAFTNCEVSISPNCCIIENERPLFTDVRSVLKDSTEKTMELLRRELEIKKGDLEQRWHMSSLEKIFIENRIYRDIEEEETWEGVLKAIDTGLAKFVATPSTIKPGDKRIELIRDITEEDLVRLTEIKIKRISKFDSFKADEAIRRLEEELETVKHHLANLVEYAIDYFQMLLDKYGKDRERRTEIRTFDQINATQVVIANRKLYMNAKEGFIGTGSSLRREEFVSDCSDIDSIIVFLRNGVMKVIRAADKVFVGKGIIYAGVWKKGDDRTTYNLIYTDKKDGRSYVKRFHVQSITRDRDYPLSKSKTPGKVLYFSHNPNGEAEIVTVKMKPGNNLRRKVFDHDFAETAIKGRAAGGNLLTKHPVQKVEFKVKGVSTLGGIDIYYDDNVKRLNMDGVGEHLGNFMADDRIALLYVDGSYELTSFEMTNRYEGRGKILEMAKFDPEMAISAIHQDGESGRYYVKRFNIETSTVDKQYPFINESEGSRLIFGTMKAEPVVMLKYSRKTIEDEELDLEEFIDVKGWRATGNKLTDEKLRKVEFLRWKEEEKEAEGEEAESAEKGAEFEAKDPKDIPFEVVDSREEEEKDDSEQGSLF